MLEGKVHVENGRIVVYDQEVFDRFAYVNETCGKCMRYYTKPPCYACKMGSDSAILKKCFDEVEEFEVDSKKLKQEHMTYDKK